MDLMTLTLMMQSAAVKPDELGMNLKRQTDPTDPVGMAGWNKSGSNME